MTIDVDRLPPPQRDLWRQVVRLWELARRRDEPAIRAALHPDYQGWDQSAAAPHDRDAALRSVTGDSPQLVDYALRPLGLRVHGGRVGVVHYAYVATVAPKGGGALRVGGKWTETYLSVDGDWLLVAVAGRPDEPAAVAGRDDAAGDGTVPDGTPEPMPEPDRALRAYYAARAPYYDDVYQRPERRADVAFLERHLPERFRDREVLEVACGTGWWTRLIAPAAARLVATDATAEPLGLARARPGTARATFVQADAYALPASLGRFDAAFAGLWLTHVPIRRRPGFLASLHARLAPGARVVLLDNSVRQCVELPIAERDAAGDTFQHRRLRDGSVHRVLKNFPTEDELRSMVAAVAARGEFRELEHFWLFEYELDARPMHRLT